MKLKSLLLSIGFISLYIVSGCGTDETATTGQIVDFDKEEDLSIYYVTTGEEGEQQPDVELRPHLDYVDTAFMERLKAGAGETSSERTSYSQYPPEWGFVIVDSRPAAVFNEGHINGAINIPDAQFDQLSHLLPAEKDILLIFYCGGMHCELSANSAEKAIELGYTNVKVYQEGMPAWKAGGNPLVVTGDYVKELILETHATSETKKPVMLLDARPYTKYFEGHIPNSIFADDTLFLQKFKSIAPQDKTTEIIAYCGGFYCLKSHTVAEYLINMGYTNVKVYSGGLPDWKGQGLPVFGTDAGDSGFNVSEGKVDRSLTPEEFVAKLNTPNVFILDVRGPTETANGMLPGATNIPDGDIHADPNAISSQLPSDKNTTILIHCASGARAAGVANKVADLGYPNTFYLNSGIRISADGSYSFP